MDAEPARRAWPLSPTSWPPWVWAVAVFVAGLAVFGSDLGGEPHFIDESAYISQSYYFDLLVSGDFDHQEWLEFAALDVPPLVKYLIGLSLRLGGFPRFAPSDASAWYRDQSYRPETVEALVAARWPSVILGAAGCAALFCLGVLAHGRAAGVTSALLLMANPLYRMLSRRAMCDVPTEALVLITTAILLWSWRRTLSGPWSYARWLRQAVLVGLFGGLAALAKLNGLLGLMIVAAVAGLTLLLRLDRRGKGAGAVAVGALVSMWVALWTFVLLNPFTTARPTPPLSGDAARHAVSNLPERLMALIEHRRTFSRQMQVWFPGDALPTGPAKLRAVATRGFGRHGVLGPRRPARSEASARHADRWALVWGSWVVLGAAWAAVRGRRQFLAGQPPVAWAVLLAAGVAFLTVTAYLPMTWDRYFLPLQSWSCLLAGCVAVDACGRLRPALSRGLAGRRRAMLLTAFGVVCTSSIFLFNRHAIFHKESETFLSDLAWIKESNGWGPVERDASNGEKPAGDGRAISLRGVTYPRGVGVHAPSEIRVALNGAYSTFRSDVGVDDEVGRSGSVNFEVWADGERLFAGPPVNGRSDVEAIVVDVSGRHELLLRVGDGGDGNHFDHADWAGARLIPTVRP